MPCHDAFLINGAWVGAHGSRRRIVVDPATEQAIAEVAMASAADVDAAVAAARRAFETWSGTSPRERIELLDRVIDRYDAAAEDLATAMTAEMGSPLAFSRTAQFGSGRAHLRTAAAILEDFRFEERDDGVLLTKLPIGVCALITPWNWPMNQLLVKVARSRLHRGRQAERILAAQLAATGRGDTRGRSSGRRLQPRQR